MFINYFIHPKIQVTNHPQFRLAKILVAGMLIIFLFFVPYSIYFYVKYPLDTFKNLTNLLGFLFFIIFFVWIKNSKNLTFIVVFSNVASGLITITSILNTGGIYSVDISWFLLSIMYAFLFVGKKWGSFCAAYFTILLSFLYFLEVNQDSTQNVYKNYLNTHNSTHFYFTWFFIFILVSALFFSLIRILDKTNQKLENLSKEKISDLESKIKEKTEEISRLRSTVAKDYFDEMGGKLTGISILSQSVDLKVNKIFKDNEISEMLKLIDIRTIDLYKGTKDFIWSIDFKSDYVNEFFIYLRDYGEVIFSNINIDFISKNEIDENNNFKLPISINRQLLYICKEIMNNIAKHSEATETTFNLKVEKNFLVCLIKENGIGFDIEQVKKSGLNLIYKRANSSNIMIEFESNLEKGVVYVLKTPVIDN